MTAPYYGKRNAGGLTASSPGDTLYFQFASYNDSGDSEALTGLAVTDLECFKNGGATARATDSGYSLVSDTGQIGDRVGLYRFSMQLFNTSDDTGFYDENSWYQVAVDSVTIDGKVVRAWVGSFEIGAPRANVVQLDGDTGFADRLGKFASLLSVSGQIDTGSINGGFIPANVRQIASDTGAATHLAQMADEHDTGRLQAEASATLDTGAINQAVWQTDASRTLTAWAFDTGVQQAITRLDTGLRAEIGNVASTVWDDNDTGHGVNIRYVNEIAVGGSGSGSDPWSPA